MANGSLAAIKQQLQRLKVPGAPLQTIDTPSQGQLTPLPAPAMPQMSAMQPLPVPQAAPPISSSQNQLAQAQAKYGDLQAKGAGVDQIQNRVGHTLAKIGTGVYSALLPGFAERTPGTEMNHQMRLDQQQGRIDEAQGNVLNEVRTQDMQAQAKQRDALAPLELARADALAHPKPTPGHLVISGDGSAAGYQDSEGNFKSLADPTLPSGVKDVAANMAAKPVKVPISEQPLDAAEAQRLNAVWDVLAAKHHLPKGQFAAGMSHSDAQTLAAGLNNVVGKQQGDSHVSISLSGLADKQSKQAANNSLDTSDPAMQSSIAAVANGSMKLTDVFGRGATTALKSQFVAAVKQVNPNYNSGDHDIENGVRKYMITGQGGVSLGAMQTTLHHLDAYDQAADAVHNKNWVLLNKIGNELGVQLGSDAQTNLGIIRDAVATEAAKAYKGAAPDVSEIEGFKKNLSGDGSPGQMHGGANTVRGLLHGKMQALQEQAAAGAQGKANFGGGNQPQQTMSATGANGHKIISNDGGTTWMDAKTGQVIR